MGDFNSSSDSEVSLSSSDVSTFDDTAESVSLSECPIIYRSICDLGSLFCIFAYDEDSSDIKFS